MYTDVELMKYCITTVLILMYYCTCINVVLFKHFKQMHVSTWTLRTTGTMMEISPGLFVLSLTMQTHLFFYILMECFCQ